MSVTASPPCNPHRQIGCYVPAAAAELAPVDRIFTRIGGKACRQPPPRHSEEL